METILFEYLKEQGFEAVVFSILIYMLYREVRELRKENRDLSEKMVAIYATSMTEATQVITSNTQVLQKVEDKLNATDH